MALRIDTTKVEEKIPDSPNQKMFSSRMSQFLGEQSKPKAMEPEDLKLFSAIEAAMRPGQQLEIRLNGDDEDFLIVNGELLEGNINTNCSVTECGDGRVTVIQIIVSEVMDSENIC